jgi:hypothetical protein
LRTTRQPPFEKKKQVKEARKLEVLLRKLNFSADEIESMPLAKAVGMLEAYTALHNPPSKGKGEGKKYVVRKKKKRRRKRR